MGKKPDGKGLIEAYHYHNTRMKALVGSEYAANTYKRFETGLKHVREFIQLHYERKDIPLKKLDLEFINAACYTPSGRCGSYMAQ